MTRTLRAFLAILLLTCGVSPTFAANGTLAPLAYQTVWDANGNPVSGAKICTYLAGTTTATPTWTEVTLTTPNTNPIIADTSGRFVAFLQTGASYKFAFQDATGTANTCDGAPIKTVDNIAAVPGSAANLDLTGVAGETLSAGQVVYLSDGSGGKTAGLWYKADSATPYSSTLPELGLVPTAIASGATGTVRQAGQISGLTSLTIGATYYVGTAGAITSTAPANSRAVGVADTTASLVTPAPALTAVAINNAVCQGRLMLTAATPITIADVTAATTLRFALYGGNLCALYSGTAWALYTFPELSIAVPATTSQMYDVFLFDNAGTRTLELLAWTNDTTRATALVTQDGVLEKTGALTRRYLGSFRTTTVSGQTEDSATKRYVWNYGNRVRRVLARLESTASWTYTTATLRCANTAGACVNQLDVVIGVAEVPISVLVMAGAENATVATWAVGIGEDSTSAQATGVQVLTSAFAGATGPAKSGTSATLVKYPAIGRHFYAWLEYSQAIGTTTWNGNTDANTTQTRSGITGWIEG
jgi:hypothetical protein